MTKTNLRQLTLPFFGNSKRGNSLTEHPYHEQPKNTLGNGLRNTCKLFRGSIPALQR